ncbi:MAG: hypothetical protein CMJ30_01160 [Phycisphaerae bacterium]|nr:hypothetical protein [Phycisphaerae bacterium]
MLAVLSRELGLAPARIRQRAQSILRELVQDCSASKVPFLRLAPIRQQLQLGQVEDALLAREAVVADLTRMLEQLSRQSPSQVDLQTCLSQQGVAEYAGVHPRTIRRWRDQGLVFEWASVEGKSQLVVDVGRLDAFLATRPLVKLRGFRHDNEVQRLSLRNPDQAQHIPRETLRRWRKRGHKRDRLREDRAAGLVWRWGIEPIRWNQRAKISDDTRRRRVQRDRVRRLLHLNAQHPIVASPRITGAPEAVERFVQARWAAHQLVMALQPCSSYGAILQAEDVLRSCGWWYAHCFAGTPQQNGALAALFPSILSGETVRFAGRLRLEVERVHHGVQRSWDASDPFGPALPGFGCQRDFLSDDLASLATAWLGLDGVPPVPWSELRPGRGPRGQADDQRMILQASGPFRVPM